MASIKHIAHTLQRHRPIKVAGRRFLRRSSVTLLLRQTDNWGICVLMIQRAERMGDPWSGHMAFPGGCMDKTDRNILQAALRELHEEIGVDSETSTVYLGRLSDLFARAHVGRKPMIVTPFVLQMDEVPELTLNHEVDDVIWVPLNYLADKRNRESMQWRYGGIPMTLPCYFYQGKRIWGMSLQMLDDLLKITRYKT